MIGLLLSLIHRRSNSNYCTSNWIHFSLIRSTKYEEKITLCRIWTYDIGFWRPTFYRTELRALSYQNRKDCKEKDSFSNTNPFYMHIFYSFIKMNDSVQFESISIDSSLLLKGAVIGRDDRIWTRDILYPKQTRYQAAPHPFNCSTVSL